MKLKVLTYNVDCLPEIIDLKDLPWILKPIVWIYKLIKKTTLIRINDNEISSSKLNKIKDYFINSGSNIIGIQEDFNYHKEIYPEDYYKDSNHEGKIEISNLKWFPFPRFKANGLNLFTSLDILHVYEEFNKWNKSNGYISHANDLLVTKGFKYFHIFYKDVYLDIYIVHMDADFYHPENCPDISKDSEARESQFKQLVDDIKEKHSRNPIIIMGDTNCYNKYEWDVNNIELNLKHAIKDCPELEFNEAIPNNYSDCDRIFYINNLYCRKKLELEDCYFDLETRLSDHRPLIATFNIIG